MFRKCHNHTLQTKTPMEKTHSIHIQFMRRKIRLKQTALIYIWASAWHFQQCGMCDQQSLRSACACAQSDQSLCQSLEYSIIVKLLTEHHLEFLSIKLGCRGSSESTHVKMPHCWKSHALAHFVAHIIYTCTPIRKCSIVRQLQNHMITSRYLIHFI